MKRLLQEAVLGTDIDFDGFSLLNVDEMLPVPSNLVDLSDARLDDPRTPPAGSVTNAKVAATADIVQSKLNLNGNIPTGWLSTGALDLDNSVKAAKGSLVERMANKNVASGYAGLDANSRVAVGQLPSTGPAAGTVNDVKL